jgi:hypothetical protein
MPDGNRAARGDRNARRLASEAPWLRDDLGPLAATTIIGAVGLVAAYLGASDSVDPARQLAWMTAAIVLMIVAGLGNAFWLGLGVRSVRARRNLLLARLRGDAVRSAPALVVTPAPRSSQPPLAALVPEEFLSYLAAEESE